MIETHKCNKCQFSVFVFVNYLLKLVKVEMKKGSIYWLRKLKQILGWGSFRTNIKISNVLNHLIKNENKYFISLYLSESPHSLKNIKPEDKSLRKKS